VPGNKYHPSPAKVLLSAVILLEGILRMISCIVSYNASGVGEMCGGLVPRLTSKICLFLFTGHVSL
jgi:hypothetical protein